MKQTLFVLSLILSSQIAYAARPDVRRLSCDRAQSIVERAGAIVLTVGDGLYDRFVANSSYCGRNDSTAPAYVTTADTTTCFIGYVCVSRDNAGPRRYNTAPRVCREGERQLLLEDNGGESMSPVPYICRSGRWGREFGGSFGGSTKPMTCREGSESIVLEDNGNDSMAPVYYVCRAGKWARKF